MKASGYERNADDWYVEPDWSVDALAAVERPFIGGVMDPCCGSGNIPKRLHANGVLYVAASDLVDRGYDGMMSRGEFSDTLASFKPASVVSNPPYNLAQEFVDCALKHTRDRVCVLLRLAFLEGQKRRLWFEQKPLARVWVSSRRMSMPPGGSDVKAKGGTIAYAWFVFEHGHRGPAQIGWLPDLEKDDK